jgi:hypothetical protein
MDAAFKILNYITDYINSVPAESWYTLGALIGSSSLVIAIVAWIKRRHLKKYAESLGRTFVTLNVVFWSAITTVLSFVLTNGSTFASFLPFLGTHWPQVVAISTVLYNVAKPSLAWFKARKEGKPLSEHPFVNPNYQPPVLTESFGTAATNRPQTDTNLIQL